MAAASAPVAKAKLCCRFRQRIAVSSRSASQIKPMGSSSARTMRIAPWMKSSTSGQDADDRRCHVTRKQPAEHCAEAEGCEVAAAFWGQRTDAADLDCDAREICEAAQCVGRCLLY